MPSRPGMYFYRDAWVSEPGLSLCSEGARYLWFEMLLVMNEQEPRGYMLVNGRGPTPAQIAALTRTDPSQVQARLAELEENGVMSRDRRGVIYSRRMVREDQKARIARENGKKGGNPTLRKQTAIPPSDNQGGKGGVILHTTRLKAQALDSESEPDDGVPESPPAAAETLPPRESEDGATAPAAAAAREIVIVPSARDFELHCLGKVGRNPVHTRRDIAAWVTAYGAPEVEMAILRTLDKDPVNPRGYTEGTLRSQKKESQAELEAARFREEHGKPDPVMEADRMTREILARMGPSNDDDTTSYPGLTH